MKTRVSVKYFLNDCRKRLLIHENSSDYIVKSNLIFVDRLSDLQLLDEIKFYVVIAGT